MASKKSILPAVSFIIIIFTIYWSLNSQLPDYIAGKNVPETAFSTNRALAHLKNITAEPHYTGSAYHTIVRDYIISELKKMGLEVTVQEQTAVNQKWRGAVKTENILARIKGTGSGKALLVLSHYDSSPHSSLGASDAGSGVVTILEAVHAFLARGEKPKNDIIILISDAEELGLLGANAFVNFHPWAKEVGLVLNFEARGSGGPSYMLIETNGGNDKLIKAFKKAKPGHPVGNSLLYSIYKMLPNDTDLTVFREDGDINGFNFAFIDDFYDYHTAQDTYERLDRNTLLQQGEYLLPLMQYFANTDLDKLKSSTDDVFFTFPMVTLVHYPFSWVFPMWGLALLWFLTLLFLGFKKNRIRLPDFLTSLGVFILVLLLSGLVSFYGWQLVLKIYPQYNDILHGFTYNGHFYSSAFITLSIAIGFWFYAKKFRKYSTETLLSGPVLIWLVINFLIVRYLPGAGFLIIPVYAALLIFTINLFAKKSMPKQVLWFTLISVPTLILLVPMIKMFPVGLGLKMTAVSSVFSVLLLGLMLPVFKYYSNVKGLTRLFFILALMAFVSAGFTADYNMNRKKPNSIVYLLNADTDSAYWASYNTTTDSFTRQFLGENPKKGSPLKDVTPSKYRTGFKRYTPAPVFDIPAPEIVILKDTVTGTFRDITFDIKPHRKVNRIDILSKNTLHFKSFSVNGISLKKHADSAYVFDTRERKQVLTYYLTRNDSIVRLNFRIPDDENPKLIIFESSWDLFKNPAVKKIIQPRDSTMIPMPFVLNDALIVLKEVNFGDPSK